MIDDDFLSSIVDLPAEEAFVLYEAKVRNDCTDNDYGELDKRDYLRRILAFIKVHDIELNFGVDIPYHDYEEFNQVFDKIESSILTYSYEMQLRAAQIKRLSARYIMTPAIQKEIHHYISLIRGTLNEAQLPADKKDTLFKRLDAFAAEVNQGKTPAGKIGDLFVGAMKRVGEGSKELEPIVGYIERICKALSKADEEIPSLPSPQEKKHIEAPKKQLSAPQKINELEDEIPF